MRPETELAVIVEAIQAATPEQPPVLPPERWGLLYMPVPEIRRAMNLAMRGRLDKINEMARALAVSTRTPDWVARMAMDAVIPTDHETELDDPDNDASALERATLAMGLNPREVAWSASIPN